MKLLAALKTVEKKCPNGIAKVYAKLARERDGSIRARLCWYVVQEAKEWEGKLATKVKRIIRRASA